MSNTKLPELLRRVAHELRTYNPAADEYKGQHIHVVWAREIDAAIALHDAHRERQAGEAVARVRTWTKNGEGHGELVDWLDGADALPDGEHDLYAAPSTQAAQAGWKMVPVEPTPEMRKAAADAWLNCDSKMLLNKAAAAVRAAVAVSKEPT